MKIAHLIKSLGRGGAEGLLPQTIRHRGTGFDYSVGYFLPWKDALAAEIEAAGAPVRCFSAGSPPGMLARVPGVVRWLRRERIDLLHAHLPLAGVVARLAGRLARVPVVYTEHNLQERYHPLTRRANSLSWSWQRQVVAVSGEVAESIRKHLGERVPVAVVRNGIELPVLGTATARREIRARFGIPERAELVGAVAVMRVQKRFDLWLEVARQLLTQRLDIHFLIVGDGQLRAELETRAAALGIAERVTFAGLQTDVRPFLEAMDLFLISSEHEGLPLALLEAMAMRLPVVATAVGGIPEVVEPGVSGMLVPFGDPAALAAAAAELLADPARRAALGEAARWRVEERFSIERMARELEAIYTQVADG